MTLHKLKQQSAIIASQLAGRCLTVPEIEQKVFTELFLSCTLEQQQMMIGNLHSKMAEYVSDGDTNIQITDFTNITPAKLLQLCERY